MPGLGQKFLTNAFGATLAAAVGAAVPAAAQQACAPREMVHVRLAMLGERQIGIGLSGPRAMLELWASAASGTWTVLSVSPGGRACVVAAGTDWFSGRGLIAGVPG